MKVGQKTVDESALNLGKRRLLESDICGPKGWCKWVLVRKRQKPQSDLRLFDFEMERAKRFELSTLTLARLCSTPELRPRPFRVAVYN